MKRSVILISILLVLLLLSGCGAKQNKQGDNSLVSPKQTEMFSTEMTASHDGAYFSVIGVRYEGDDVEAVVNVFSEMGECVDSFVAGNVDSFFGVCWEKDSYNIWTLSTENGLSCYTCKDEKWTLDESSVLPEYMK